MSGLVGEAPLALMEDFSEFGDFQTSNGIDHGVSECPSSPPNIPKDDDAYVEGNFIESLSISLEDLVQSFDEKIMHCFSDYDESVETVAPFQSHEEILSDNPTWKQLSENYGNILPFDFEKSHTRALQIKALHLPIYNRNDLECKNKIRMSCGEEEGIDEDELAKDLDLHSLILNSSVHQHEPVISADQVLREINEMMGEEGNDQDSGMGRDSSATTTESSPSSDSSLIFQSNSHSSSNEKPDWHSVSSIVKEDKLKHLMPTTLNEVIVEQERMIQSLSETLIQELALRDEFEFEKEVKNNFISLLLAIQNKKRQNEMNRRKMVTSSVTSSSSSLDSMKYLTTVIPYDPSKGPPDVRSLQVLMKILQAITEDSPTVPALLTDYILKVLCPT